MNRIANKYVIGIVSGKGGVGKSTIGINVATLLSLKGVPTIILDADFYNPCVGMHLGIVESATGLQHILNKGAKVDNAIITYPASGLRIIPAFLGYVKDIKTENMKSVVSQLNYEYVIIDCSPGLPKPVTDVINVCNELFVVLTPDVPSLTSANKIITLVNSIKKNVKMTFILNRVKGKRYEIPPKEIESLSNMHLSAVINEDDNVSESIAAKVPIVMYKENSPASKQLKEFAQERVVLYSFPGSYVYQGPLAWLINLIKKLFKS